MRLDSNVTDIRDQDTDTHRPRAHDRTKGETATYKLMRGAAEETYPADPVTSGL